MKLISALIIIALAMQPAAAAAASAEDVLRSLIIPGWGQYGSGRYARGTLMLGSAIMTVSAIAGTTLQYNRYVDSFEDAQRRYQAAAYVGDAVHYHRQATDNWDRADRMHRHRSLLLGAAAAIWAWSALDMAFGPGGGAAPIALEPAPGGFKLSVGASF